MFSSKLFYKSIVTIIVGLLIQKNIVQSQLSADAIRETREVALECMSTVSANLREVHNFMNQLPATTNRAMCLRFCVMHEFNMMDKVGNMQENNIMNYVLKNMKQKYKMEVADIVQKCLNIDVIADKCETAELFHRCLLKEENMLGLDLLRF